MTLHPPETWKPQQQSEWNAVDPTSESRFKIERSSALADQAAVAVGGLETIISWPRRETGADFLG